MSRLTEIVLIDVNVLVSAMRGRAASRGGAGAFRTSPARSGAIGNLVADAWHAALVIEHGCSWISDDADFGRFPDLRWRRLG
ncbi:MAG: hypothetical protein IT360_14435 [Gemmatimonadaceae bacterium]|nr:hypothetical protein [Gemmatimonadaceae bacterium]